MTNKKAIVNSLHLLLPSIMEETHTSTNRTTGEITNKREMNKDGELRLWLEIALNKEEWAYHIRKLQQPGSNNQEYQSNLPIPTNHNDNRTHKTITTTMKKQTTTTVNMNNNSRTHTPFSP